MGDAISNILDERDECMKYIRENLKTLLPYLVDMEPVRQLVLWHRIHFKGKVITTSTKASSENHFMKLFKEMPESKRITIVKRREKEEKPSAR